jgi:hypothetical protein
LLNRTLINKLAGVVGALLLGAAPGWSDQLITNGAFETGTLSGWTVVDSAGSFGPGTWFASDTTTGPVSGFVDAGPASGQWFALSDQTGGGAHALLQSFVVAPDLASLTLSFDMFVNDWDGGPICPPGGSLECGRVDILSSTADAFDTSSGVVQSLYLGTDPNQGVSNPYTHYSFNLTDLAPGAYQLRFAVWDNIYYFNMGVDNVSLEASPEPTSWVLFAIATTAFLGIARFRMAVQSR